LELAAAQEGFGVIAVHDVRQTMANKGVEFPEEVHVVEVCQPHHAARVLGAKLEVSAALPCRIGVFSRAGRTHLTMIRPKAMLGMFHIPEVADVAEEVEVAMTRMLERART
ncbi:MAG: DUF302 domain-containing protein, partial [Planctomycetota bacterium]|nr:DUF302 domain-containing protein [Planctomycetota bacterium]